MNKNWADKLCVNKLKRDGFLPENYKQNLIDNVESAKFIPPHIKDNSSQTDENRQRRIKMLQKEDQREETIYKWKQKGITVYASYNQPTKIDSVKIDFSDYEWVNLLNKEGKYLPVCCANISEVRDILMSVIREECIIETRDLAQVVFLIKNHGCEDYEENHPLMRLVNLYEQMKDDCRTDDMLFIDTVDLNNPKECLEALANYVNHYNNFSFDYTSDSEERKFDNCVNREKALIDLVPIINTLHDKIKHISNPITGFGIVDKNNKVATTRAGIAVYHNKEIAQEICDNWNKNKNKENFNFIVKRVTVSMTEGILVE